MIRQLDIRAEQEVRDLFAAVIEGMREQGIYQWDRWYPDGQTLSRDLRAGHAWGLFLEGSLEAYICLNEACPPEYASGDWQCADGPVMIVHRLCVHPGRQGRGRARELMEFAEQRAARAGYRAVRLDAFSGNPAALRLYDRLGYRRCGTARFRGRGFVLFEKVLERDSEDDVVPR